ncbi:MAG: LptA/OstA family protein [Pseudodonghicola sp.]|nr:LptA/OstA family protein [Pseudodonghicola sp.]
MSYLRVLFLCLPVVLSAGASAAQGTTVAFGATPADPSQPVEVTAENLDVNQADGSAEFAGDVLVIQGEMRMTADRVFVAYDRDASRIARLEASGGVLLVNGPDAAESESAVYSIDSGVIVMTGNVLLTQGPSVLSSNRMTVNLTTGTAQMAGRVKTILNPTPRGDD